MENINLHEAEKITELPYGANGVFIKQKRKWPKILLSIVAGIIVLCTLLYLIFPGLPYYAQALQLDDEILYTTLQNYSHYDKTLTGETQKIECNGLTITLPSDMVKDVNTDSEESTTSETYRKSEFTFVMFPRQGIYSEGDIFSQMDENIPQGKIDYYKEEIRKSMGEFPETNYKFSKMSNEITINDMQITNKYQSNFCYSLLIAKAVMQSPTDHYLFEKGNVCGFLTFDGISGSKIANTFDLLFYNKDDENTMYQLLILSRDDSFTDTAYAIINSIQFNK